MQASRLQVLIIGDGEAWRGEGTSAAEDPISRVLDVAATVTRPWAAIVSGSLADAIAPDFFAARSGGGRVAARWRKVARIGGPNATVARLVWILRHAAGRRPDAETVVVLADPALEAVLSKRGLVRTRREARPPMVGLVAWPGRDPHEPRWAPNEVRDREQALQGTMEPDSAGPAALLAIAREWYGFAILPAERQRTRAWERLGFRFLEPLEADPLFDSARLPLGWTLEPSPAGAFIEMHDEHGVARGWVVYHADPRRASMGLALGIG